MKKNISYFLIGTFSITYLFHGLLVLLTRIDRLDLFSLPGMALLILGGSAPTVMAFLMIHHRHAKEEQRFFYRRLLHFRQTLPDFLYALMIPVLLGVLAIFVRRALYDTPWTAFDFEPFYWFIPFLFIGIFMGGLEEVGWRGYLQEYLIHRNPIVVAVIIGFIWGLWHFPMFFILGSTHADYAFVPFLIQAIVYSLFLSGLYLKTRSTFLTILFHATINATAGLGFSVVYLHTSGTYLYLGIAMLIGVMSLFQMARQETPHI